MLAGNNNDDDDVIIKNDKCYMTVFEDVV